MAKDIFHQLYFHFVWTTRERLQIPSPKMREWLREEILAQCPKRGGAAITCFVMPDHVHLLADLPPCDLGIFIGQVKGAACHAFNQEFGEQHLLKWQVGYGILSLRQVDVPKVEKYINHQEQIHASRRTLDLMETYEIEIPTSPPPKPT
jgi:putative transposase